MPFFELLLVLGCGTCKYWLCGSSCSRSWMDFNDFVGGSIVWAMGFCFEWLCFMFVVRLRSMLSGFRIFGHGWIRGTTWTDGGMSIPNIWRDKCIMYWFLQVKFSPMTHHHMSLGAEIYLGLHFFVSLITNNLESKIMNNRQQSGSYLQRLMGTNHREACNAIMLEQLIWYCST